MQKTRREHFCCLIGCSGFDPDCPGNPLCDVVIKFFGLPYRETTDEERIAYSKFTDEFFKEVELK